TRDQARRVLARVESKLSPTVSAGIQSGWTSDAFHADQLAAVLDLPVKAIDDLLTGVKPPRPSTHASPISSPLTEQELEILRLVAEGLTNRQIAGQRTLSVNTIKWYVKEIFSKLDVSSRTEAVSRARALGLLD